MYEYLTFLSEQLAGSKRQLLSISPAESCRMAESQEGKANLNTGRTVEVLENEQEMQSERSTDLKCLHT